MKVYLSGVENGSKWRENLIPKLKIEYYNPLSVPITEETITAMQNERNAADFLLYVVTPKMNDMFIISELTDESNKRPNKLIFCFLSNDEEAEFNKHQIKSLNATGKMVRANGAIWFETMEEVVEFLNGQKK